MVQTTLGLCRFVWPTKRCHDKVNDNNDNNENRQKKSWKIQKKNNNNNKQVYLETQLNQCKVIEAPNKLDQSKRVSENKSLLFQKFITPYIDLSWNWKIWILDLSLYIIR